jgi:NAD+ synthase
VRKKIVNWLKKQVRASGAKGIILGLSGGIDSAVVAALAREAVGKDNLLVLLLPCHSQSQDMQDALLVSRHLGITAKTIDLSGIYDIFIKTMPAGNRLAAANLKPRLRMVTLYYFANTLNYLVCGTGNKSELSVGYFTKYGDGGTDILPIGGLLKRDVRRLARELKIPEQVIIKPPTAGLWPGQTDEGEMGITYDELDDILHRMAKKKKQALPRAKVDKVARMMKRSEHKRRGPEICKV